MVKAQLCFPGLELGLEPGDPIRGGGRAVADRRVVVGDRVSRALEIFAAQGRP